MFILTKSNIFIKLYKKDTMIFNYYVFTLKFTRKSGRGKIQARQESPMQRESSPS